MRRLTLLFTALALCILFTTPALSGEGDDFYQTLGQYQLQREAEFDAQWAQDRRSRAGVYEGLGMGEIGLPGVMLDEKHTPPPFIPFTCLGPTCNSALGTEVPITIMPMGRGFSYQDPTVGMPKTCLPLGNGISCQ